MELGASIDDASDMKRGEPTDYCEAELVAWTHAPTNQVETSRKRTDENFRCTSPNSVRPLDHWINHALPPTQRPAIF